MKSVALLPVQRHGVYVETFNIYNPDIKIKPEEEPGISTIYEFLQEYVINQEEDDAVDLL